MALWGIPKYSGPPLVAGGKRFVPDFFDKGSGLIGDLKSGKKIVRTPQLEAIVRYAEDNGMQQPWLIISGSNEPYISTWVKNKFRIEWGP